MKQDQRYPAKQNTVMITPVMLLLLLSLLNGATADAHYRCSLAHNRYKHVCFYSPGKEYVST